MTCHVEEAEDVIHVRVGDEGEDEEDNFGEGEHIDLFISPDS